METFVLVFAFLLLIIVAMSVGVLMGRKPIAGSCGGMASLGMDTACDICGGDKTICDDEDEKARRIEEIKKADELSYELK
ncbi:(Na+)-NQR maturation NqrM [Neptunomonas marina]|uniref:(Na+)-NQR maturation NqrM n=1 Tax=Neptunomonas marina TaxID=1815562 RepID=A0A437QD91_9GAMM|nr:(Na+)-NQR maturation NqrM [Neptunomonas marina]RVU32507.1 (Na+)-NQR maturation NqrM [Neptunomonas marina]